MGNKDAAVFRHLRQIMVDYEEDYENKQENMWKKEFFKYCKCIDETTNELTAQINEYAYSAQNLGFVQGMNFALDITPCYEFRRTCKFRTIEVQCSARSILLRIKS